MLLVLERTYAHWHATGEWPQLEMLQRQFAAERADVNVRVIATSRSGLVNLSPAEQQVQLTLRGLSKVPAARPLLDAYLRAVRAMLDRYRDTKVDAIYGLEDVKALGLDLALERELSELLRHDGLALGNGGGGNDGWSFQITDRVVAADDVSSVEELMAVIFGEPLDQDEEPAEPKPDPLSSAPGAEPIVNADRPIDSVEQDLLDRAPLAQVLAAQATAQVGDGFVMGVAGAWGSGKTSLLNLMVGVIKERNAGYVVRFDPWLFSSSEELVLRFLREVQAQLGRSGQLGEAAARIGEYAQLLAPLSTLAHAPWLTAPMTVSGLLARRRLKRQAGVSAQEQRVRVAEVLGRLDRRLVVVIDDLDRLMPGEVRDVVRLVKLVADFPNTTYVLAYDQQRVASALGASDEQDGLEFLEKIVQLTHEVPPVSSMSISRVLTASINAAVGDLERYRFDESAYANLFAHAQELFGSVRDVRRFTNVLPGTLALTGKEVELADVLALEALRVRVPASFALIVAARQALTQPAGGLNHLSDEVARAQVRAIVDAAGVFAMEVAEIVKLLFPASAHHLGGVSYGREWLRNWRQAGRVAHSEVLGIYLAKALPPGVLPVTLVESVLQSLEDKQALTGLLDSLTDEQLESLLDRLEHYEDKLSTLDPQVPIAVLFNQQHRLKRPRRHTLDISAELRVPRVVLRLLRQRKPSEVARIVEAAIPKIRTLSDRGHLIRMVGYHENSGHKLVNEQDAARFEASFLDELMGADAASLLAEADMLRLLFWLQQQHPEKTDARLAQLLGDDAFVLGLLGAALGETLAQTIGEAAVHRARELNWDTLTALVEESVLTERIRQLDNPETRKALSSHTALALRLALERIAQREQKDEDA